MSRRFTLFLDDSGSPKPAPGDKAKYFALGGVLVEEGDIALVRAKIEAFKADWGIDYPLHGSEIRSMKQNFSWLERRPPDERELFLKQLAETITECPILVHACVISRQGYLDRFYDLYQQKPWEMMKSAFSIIVERAAKYVAANDGVMLVNMEQMGRVDERRVRGYFAEMTDNGAPFDPGRSGKYAPLTGEALKAIVRGLDFKSKTSPIMQMADLCLYPVVIGRDKPDNLALAHLRSSGRLIDTVLAAEDLSTMGIKYYCF